MSTTITHKRLVSAFIKNGCTITNIENWHTKDKGKPSNGWIATNPANGRKLEWHTQDGFVPAKDGVDAHWDKNNQVTRCVTWRSPDTDAMSDYFADSYFHTIKSAVCFITGSSLRHWQKGY